MKIHEYQAKQLLKNFKVAVAPGVVIDHLDQVDAALQAVPSQAWAIKAQIHAGGRGKGGGVKVAKSHDQVHAFVKAMLGIQLITPQTGPQGQTVKKVYIESGCDIAQELYFSLLIDRKAGCITAIASAAGGMNIEEVAEHTPDQIHKIQIDPDLGFQAHHARTLSFAMGLRDKTALKVAEMMRGCYQAFQHYDASLVEINPLVITKLGDALALDAKMSFDDNALFRHPDILSLRDLAEEDPTETEASKHELSYVKLDGNIGCLVNGAGLAMATMDVIKLYGGEPANFLDVGGGASKERVATAFRLILADPNVKGILVNIFGGIMRCDIIASGIVAAAQEMQIKVPLVVRLQGTNSEAGQEILSQSTLSIISENALDQAALRIVQAVGGQQ